MRISLFIIAIFICFAGKAQDKIYLKDNSVLSGKIISQDLHSIQYLLNDEIAETATENVVIIIFENGDSQVISKKTETTNTVGLPEWMIGINILQPVSLAGGFMIEKNITKRYSLRVGEVFMFDTYYGAPVSCTSIMNNVYLGKGRVKALLSGGVNVLYSENPYYFTDIYPLIDDYTIEYIWMPPNGRISYWDVELSFGAGIYVDLTKHCSFLTQLSFGSLMIPNYSDIQLDIVNSGFSFFYKF